MPRYLISTWISKETWDISLKVPKVRIIFLTSLQFKMVRQKLITKELAVKWAVKRANESDNTCYKRVMYLIHFACFLNDSGYKSYIPRLPRAYKSTFTPYIFSHKEMETIFAASDQLEMNNSMYSTVNAIPAILRMLYGTGI